MTEPFYEKASPKTKGDWWETATEWVCTECGTTNPMSHDVCSGCDCSLDGFVDDSWRARARAQGWKSKLSELAELLKNLPPCWVAGEEWECQKALKKSLEKVEKKVAELGEAKP